MTRPASYPPAPQVALLRHRLVDLSALLVRIDPADLSAEALAGLDQLQDTVSRLLPILSRSSDPDEAASRDQCPSTDLGALLLDIEARWSPRALRRGLGFAVTHPQSLRGATTLPVNAGVLDRGLALILGRALSVSQGGTIRLRADQLENGDLTLTVQDTGPPDPDAANRDLSQVAVIAEMLGATLSARVAAASGLAVTLRLPRNIPAATRDALASTDAGRPEPAPHPTADTIRFLDPDVLEALFQMTGPETRTILLARISEDLARADADIAKAAEGMDLDGLRSATHVLMAMAGTIGATSLAEAARHANAIAHLGGAEECVALVPRISDLIAQATGAVHALRSATIAARGAVQ